MKYMLVNTSQGNLCIDLYKSKQTYKNENLHRVAPHVAISLGKGSAVDILPHFGGSLEEAHAAVKHSRDTLRMIRPDRLNIYVCDDEGNEVSVESVLGLKDPKEEKKKSKKESKEKPKDEDATKPDMGQGAVIAAVDHHEAEAKGETSTDDDEDKKESFIDKAKGALTGSSKKKAKKKK